MALQIKDLAIRSRYNYMLRETPKVKAEARNRLIYYDYVIRDQDTVLQQIPIVSFFFFDMIKIGQELDDLSLLIYCIND